MGYGGNGSGLLYGNRGREFMGDRGDWDPRAEQPDDVACVEYAGAKFARGASSRVPGVYADRAKAGVRALGGRRGGTMGGRFLASHGDVRSPLSLSPRRASWGP